MYLDDKVLENFMHRFLGYGSFNSDFWFIGMEEGSSNSFEEINARIIHWENGGQKELEDVAKYHEKLGIDHFFTEPPKNQSTWNKLIRILLAYEGVDPSLKAVKSYQKTSLARGNSNNCLLELFPLPARKSTDWIYSKISKVEWLSSREEYKKHLINYRIKLLREKIHQHAPKLVVLYANNKEYRSYWEMLTNKKFQQIEIKNRTAFTTSNDKTLFIITDHPVSFGVTIEYFHAIGQLARDRIDS